MKTNLEQKLEGQFVSVHSRRTELFMLWDTEQDARNYIESRKPIKFKIYPAYHFYTKTLEDVNNRWDKRDMKMEFLCDALLRYARIKI